MYRLLLATANQGKIREMSDLFSDMVHCLKLLKLSDLNICGSAPETGNTFRENAVEKSIHYCNLAGKEVYVIGEDSGLEIEALNGEPGIYSSRYAGDKATDSENIQKVLKRLEGISNRRARFKAAVALSLNGRILETFTGTVEGQILERPRGSSGFGYDPIFFYPPLAGSFAEIGVAEKNRVSHRSIAFNLLKNFVLDCLSLELT